MKTREVQFGDLKFVSAGRVHSGHVCRPGCVMVDVVLVDLTEPRESC